MKKLTAHLLALTMGLFLVACSSVDRQPAVDAYNELCENYNKFVELGNANIDSIAEEDVEFLNSIAAGIDEYGETLNGDTELTQEEVDEMVEMFKEFNAAVKEALDNWE